MTAAERRVGSTRIAGDAVHPSVVGRKEALIALARQHAGIEAARVLPAIS